MKLFGLVEKGRLLFDDRTFLAIVLREFEGRRVTVEIDKEKKLRTLKQNARYWSLLFPMAKHHLNSKREIAKELPLNKEQVHAVLVSAFVGQEMTELGPVYVSTKTLSVQQFTILTDRVEKWLNDLDYDTSEGAARDWATAEAEENVA